MCARRHLGRNRHQRRAGHPPHPQGPGHGRAVCDRAPEGGCSHLPSPPTPTPPWWSTWAWGTLPSWAANVQHRGLDPATPAVAIERGTTDQQRAVYAPVQSLPDLVAQHKLESPALIIVGPVVALSPGWRACQESGNRLREGRWVASGSSPSPSSSQACNVLALAASVGADARTKVQAGHRQA